MTEPERFDLCVLGAGPAGYAAAVRGYDLGKRVLLVERAQIGGTGIHNGALSSKTMWHLSNDYAGACRTDRGFQARGIDLTYGAVMDSVRGAVRERRDQLTREIEYLDRPSANGGRVQFVRGTASFLNPHAVTVGGTRYDADFVLVATGSRPRNPPGIEVDGKIIVTSDHIEQWTDFPKSLLIIGAGVIGCEYATMFANFGRTDIRILDRQPRILPFEDEDVAEVIAENFERLGITLHRESKLESLRVVDGQVEYVITNALGQTERHLVERALVSIGRAPNTDDLNLAAAEIAIDKSGGVAATMTRSSQPHIYAAGDVSLDVALVNVAELEGRHAVEVMFGLGPAPIRYEALSAIMFLKPEVASVGLNELQAKKAEIPYRVAVLSNALINRNIAMRSTTGFVKLLARRDAPAGLLGLRVVGPQASSAIQGIAYLIDRGAHVEDIDRCVHPHPAITEGVQECARLLLGRSIMKPEVFGPNLVRCAEG